MFSNTPYIVVRLHDFSIFLPCGLNKNLVLLCMGINAMEEAKLAFLHTVKEIGTPSQLNTLWPYVVVSRDGSINLEALSGSKI